MMFRVKNMVILTVLLLLVTQVHAQFNAADLVYVPIVAHNEGVDDSVWRSDLYITNADSTPIDVAMFFVASGLYNNSGVMLDRVEWMGGRADDGWGIINEDLIDIPVGGTVLIEDVVDFFSDYVDILTGTGALTIFAYEAGTLDDEGGRTVRNIIVNTRTYNQTTVWVEDDDNEGEFIQEDATYGQMIPGVAWYNLGDAGSKTANGDFSYQILNIGAYSSDYRYNFGLLNASDRLTTLNVVSTPYDSEGNPLIDENETIISINSVLPPLAHIQYNSIFSYIFDVEEQEVAKIEAVVTGWTTTNSNPVPLFTTYASLVDNRSSDPTSVLPSFEAPYNVDCMWAPEEDPEEPQKTSAGGTDIRRPQDIPPRN